MLSIEITIIRFNRNSSVDFPSFFDSEAGSTEIYVLKSVSLYPNAEIVMLRRMGSSPGTTVIESNETEYVPPPIF